MVRMNITKASVHEVRIGNVAFGGNAPIALIAGPCVIESHDHTLKLAEQISAICLAAGVPFVFKASFDKANRTSVKAYRGPGSDEGLRILAEVKVKVGVPVLTDVHEPEQAALAAEVVDVLQIPAFLCRQTDLLLACARTGKPVNVKKGQFLAPWDMKNVVEKIRSAGNEQVLLTERGASFGYNNLVSDMRSLVAMREFGVPVIFDATHSVQLPGGQGASTGGQRQFVFPLTRAAVATGVDGIFVETHDDPDRALSDGPNVLPLENLPAFLDQLKRLDAALKE
jgi:2-dehydro-3-deoxyphosphooctonate aldolase (KDO 8-P synthase)